MSDTNRRKRHSGGGTGACPSGKRAYPTRAEASALAKALRRTKDHVPGHNRPYRCPHCELWHVGHLPPAVIEGRTTASDYYYPEEAC